MANLVQLPTETLVKILGNRSISGEDLISLSKVCQRFKEICELETLWKIKFQQQWSWAWKRINSVNTKTSISVNWRKEFETAIEISNKLEEILGSLNYYLFNHKSITLPILNSIIELLQAEKFGSLIVLNKLLWIVFNEREEDLTKHYYAKKVLLQVNHYLCKKEFKEFFNLPPEKHTLEKGVFLFSKWIKPEKFHSIEYEEVSLKLDKLAFDVQSYLRKKNSNHPASFTELFCPENTLDNVSYSDDECIEILECINHILYKKYNFRAVNETDDIENICLNMVLDSKIGSSMIICVIYKVVSHRLGVHLDIHGLNDTVEFDFYDNSEFEDDEVDVSDADNANLLWISPVSNQKKFINPFNGERTEGVLKTRHLPPRNPIISILNTLAAHSADIARENRSLERDTYSMTEEEIYANGMFLFVLSLRKYLWNGCFRETIDYCLKKKIHLETVKEICEFDPSYRKYLFSTQIEKLLLEQLKDPEPIEPKIRSKNARFAIGMIVGNLEDNYTGVIIGWFVVSKWKMKTSKFRNRQIMYKVLSSEGVDVFSGKDLFVKKNSGPIEHPEIGKYFKMFNGTFYVPNKELRSKFPVDEKFSEDFLRSDMEENRM